MEPFHEPHGSLSSLSWLSLLCFHGCCIADVLFGATLTMMSYLCFAIIAPLCCHGDGVFGVDNVAHFTSSIIMPRAFKVALALPVYLSTYVLILADIRWPYHPSILCGVRTLLGIRVWTTCSMMKHRTIAFARVAMVEVEAEVTVPFAAYGSVLLRCLLAANRTDITSIVPI